MLFNTRTGRMLVITLLVAGFAAMLSCVFLLQQSRRPPPSPPAKATAPAAKPGATVVRVFYGTDRNRTEAGYGTQRGTPELGYVDVSVPLTHRMGQIERPAWYLERFVPLDPEKHMVVVNRTPLTSAEFFRLVRQSAAQGDKAPAAFVFVHGFRVTWEDAALRTGQIAVDLGLPTLPSFYSWPSQGKTALYPVDDGNAEWAIPHLATFLEGFADHAGLVNIYVIAHSMGTNLTAKAVVSLLSRRQDLASRFSEVVLAAPDIDATIFKRDIAPKLVPSSHVTLYASANDKALLASKAFRGGYSRAGEAGAGLVVLPQMETVDASLIDTDFLGHSYYGDSRPLLTDIALILGEHHIHAQARPTLREVKARGTPSHWEFKP